MSDWRTVMSSHRNNLVKLIGEDAPSNKFLEELLKLRETFLKFGMKVPGKLEGALTFALFDFQHPSSGTRRSLILSVYELIKYEIDPMLYEGRGLVAPQVKAKDFPAYEDVLSEGEIKECFISKGPLKGIWFKEFPLGLNRVIRRAIEEREKSLDWPEEKLRNLFLRECRRPDLILIESKVIRVYERMLEKEVLALFLLYKDDPEYLFNGKSVYLFEAKSSRKDIPKGVEQLLEYQELFKEDYPRSFIKGLGIICSEWTRSEIEICKKKGITPWEVTCESVLQL